MDIYQRAYQIISSKPGISFMELEQQLVVDGHIQKLLYNCDAFLTTMERRELYLSEDENGGLYVFDG